MKMVAGNSLLKHPCEWARREITQPTTYLCPKNHITPSIMDRRHLTFFPNVPPSLFRLGWLVGWVYSINIYGRLICRTGWSALSLSLSLSPMFNGGYRGRPIRGEYFKAPPLLLRFRSAERKAGFTPVTRRDLKGTRLPISNH